MARWTPEQIKEKLGFWISAEDVEVDKENVYGQEIEFVKEAKDKSNKGNSAYNLDQSNSTRPILKKNSLNGKPTISFGDFDLSKIGESLNNFSSNDYIIPDFLMVNHSEELDLSKNGVSIYSI